MMSTMEALDFVGNTLPLIILCTGLEHITEYLEQGDGSLIWTEILLL